MKKIKKRILIISIVITIIITIASLYGGYVWYQQQLNTPFDSASQSEVDFVIQEGESVEVIAQRLKDAGIIGSTKWFLIYLRQHPDLASGIQAGEFSLRSADSIVEIVSLLQNGVSLKRITFIEGWRREQMANYLAGKFGENFAQEFLLISANDEGYLFPDTYLVPFDSTPQGVVDLMKQTLNQKLTAERQAQMQAMGFDLPTLINFAAMVEREIALSEDRRIVAGILIKRWRNDWLIGVDATVQYLMATMRCEPLETECDWWPQEITFEDLSIESPYNTRKNLGLPPAPIANPGIDAIDAVLWSVESEYWYYLSDEFGQTHYARTFEEHSANILNYL